MVLKIFKAIWFFSLFALLGAFMYIYAALPVTVMVNDVISLSKETLFYSVLALLALVNTMVFVVNKIFPDKEVHFKSWFAGLISCANLFFIVGLALIWVSNAEEKYNYESVGFIVYGSLFLLAGWAIAWPVYRITEKFSSKEK